MLFRSVHRQQPAAPSPRLRWLLVLCCVLAAVATAFPWTRVAFESLWGAAHGPIGWHTDTGFTCLTACLLAVTVAAMEDRSPRNQHAARTAVVAVLAVATCAVTARLWNGAGLLRGVTAAHTGWFLLAAVLVPIAALASGRRLRDSHGRDPRAA